MPSWVAIDRFFAANLETLAAAEPLRALVAGGQQLKLPVIGYDE
jgi:hypothetical protein